MPCLILTGYPSSGKSTLAELFRQRALLLFSGNNNDNNRNTTTRNKNTCTGNNRIEHVVIVTEATACPDQTTRACYSDSQAEKATRSALRAAFDRAVGAAAAASTTAEKSGDGDSACNETTLIILDSVNYIKGFRYELHCISKAAKERHAVVWVMNDVAVSKQWNEHRKTITTDNDADDYYTNEQMEELILRYEPPDARNRWDKPLYRVDMRPSASSSQQASGSTTATPGENSSNSNQQQQQQGLAKETLERSVYNMHDLSETIHLQQEMTIPVVAPSPNKKMTTTSMGGFKRASNKTHSNINNNNSTNTKHSQTDNKDESVNKPEAAAAAFDDASKSVENETSSAPSNSSAGAVLSLEERVDAILDSFLNHVQPLQQSFSTQEQLASSDANVLQKVDMVTQQICLAIVTAQNINKQQHQPTCAGSSSSNVSGGEKLAIHLLHQKEQLTLNCHRHDVPLSSTELQRIRKQYVQWVKSQPPRDTSQRGIAQSFLQYIEASAQQ